MSGHGIDSGLMAEIVRRIVAVADPDRVILFGSGASGDRTATSTCWSWRTTRGPALCASALHGALCDIPIPMDILVFQPDEIKEWSRVPQALVTTAAREGRVLYENHG